MPKRGFSGHYALKPPQVHKLMVACSTLEERVCVGCLVYLGLRIQELGHMKASWINTEGNFRLPFVQKCDCSACRNNPRHPREWRPKTDRGARVLHIPGVIKRDVLKFLELQPEGFQLSRITLYHIIKAVLKRAGIRVKGLGQDTIFPHALRATWATMLASGGMDRSALAYSLGHKHISEADRYVQLAQAQDEAMRKTKEILG